MLLFEWILGLLLVAVVLASAARVTGAPYPALLALAGAAVAFSPLAPRIVLEPELALALFVAPVLLDTAFDTSPRDLRRNVAPLASLVIFATLSTAAVVAWVGCRFGGLPLAAALALGAIVSPPDAAAASAVLSALRPPRNLVLLLQSESLLNDAVALLLYRFAVYAVMADGGLMHSTPVLVLTAALSVPAGWLMAWAYRVATVRVSDAASATVLQFVGTFGVWILADRLGLSAIVATVVYAITLAQGAGSRAPARMRISSYSVWETVVFILNVLAFMLMGLQARPILSHLHGTVRVAALMLAGEVFAAVVVVRIAWIALHILGAWLWRRLHARPTAGSLLSDWRYGALASWCGMRGLVTLAAAFALPPAFPGRDQIVLCAFAVVLGTLVLQGSTLKLLMRRLNLPADDSAARDLSHGRVAIMEAALDRLGRETGEEAAVLRQQYSAAAEVAHSEEQPQGASAFDTLRLEVIEAQREALSRLWRSGAIGDDAFRLLQEEIDWSELDAAPAGRFQPLAIDTGPRD